MDKKILRSVGLVLVALASTSMMPEKTFANKDVNNEFNKYSPAVSALNGSIDLAGGSIDGSGAAQVSGIVSVPVSNGFGFQVDTLLGQFDSYDYGGLGAHYFYRNPEKFLLGATTMFYTVDGVDTYRTGLESELYLGDFTIAAEGGRQHGHATIDTVGYGALDFSYYPKETLKLTVGAGRFHGVDSGYAEVVWQQDVNSPYTFFVLAGDAEYTDGFILAGATYSFGTDGQTLKHKDRYSDPKNIVKGINTGSGGSGGAITQLFQNIQNASGSEEEEEYMCGSGGGGGELLDYAC